MQIQERLQDVQHQDQTWLLAHQLAAEYDVPYEEV